VVALWDKASFVSGVRDGVVNTVWPRVGEAALHGLDSFSTVVLQHAAFLDVDAVLGFIAGKN